MPPAVRPRLHFPLPPFLLVSSLTATLIVHRWRPIELGLPQGLRTPLALALLAAGSLLGGSAILWMVRARTPVEPGHTPNRLVTGGPFRISRNPIYVGFVLLHLAAGAALDSLWIAGGAPLLALLLDRLVIRKEELLIGSEFGEEYTAYCRRTRRWI
jgi:protein-S-isoprenylcysteine O-methyltransferase Ste14